MATVNVNQTWTSGEFSTTNNYVKFKVRIKEVSYDTIANTSEVTVSVYAYRTNSGYTTYGSGTIDVTIDGTNYHKSISPTITNSNTTIFTQNVTVQHDPDGSLTLTTSTEWRINAPGSGSYTYTGTTSAKNFNKALSVIPRGSTITAPDTADMGTSISIEITQADASQSHRLYYQVPGGSEVLIGSYAGDHTYTWTVFDDASSMSGTVSKEYYTLICHTYFTNDYTGEYVETTRQLLAYVGPSSYPTITIGAITEAGSVPVGFPFLVGLSIPQITTTATAKDNATLVSRTYTLTNGDTKTVTTSAQTDTVTMSTPLNTTSTTLTATATDSRGTSGTATQVITAVAYTAPSIEIRVTRSDSLGTADAVGTYCKVEAKWTWTSVLNPSEVNGATITISVNSTPTATYTTGTNTQTAFTQIALLSGIAITDQYVIGAVITDNVGQTAPDSKTITKAQLPLSLYDDGVEIGVTIGRMATQGDLNVWLDTRLISGNNLILNDGNGSDTDTMPTDNLFKLATIDTVVSPSSTNLVQNSAIADELYYKAGDTVTLGPVYVSGGSITGGTAAVTAGIEFPKRLDKITTVSCTKCYTYLRGINGYINSDSSRRDFVGRSGYTVACEITGSNSIRLAINKSSAYTNATNNTPITLDGEFVFSFS